MESLVEKKLNVIKLIVDETLHQLTDVIPDEINKDISRLPKEVKSNIKDIITFAKEYGCPECNSKNIRLVGFMEDGKQVMFGCVDCQYKWIVEDLREEGEKTLYKFSKVEFFKKVWDKVYPDLIKSESKFYNRLKNTFKNIKEEYLSLQPKKYANKDIGSNELKVVIEEEMDENAKQGQDSIFKELKRPIPKTINPFAIEFIKSYSLELSRSVSKNIKNNIKKQIEEGMKVGEGVRKIKNRINNVFDKGVEINVPEKILNGKVVRKAYTKLMSVETRARIIAQTETMRAFNRGRFDSLKSIDEVTGWKYEASADERTCKICQDLDGREFKKDDETYLPPSPHASCRCTFSMILGKKKQSKPKFVMHKHNNKLKFSLDKKALDSKSKIDKGWVEFGVKNEYFLHGKKYNGRWIMKKGILKKAKSSLPFVFSQKAKDKDFVPKKSFSALPKSWRVKIPKELRWWEKSLIGMKARLMINEIKEKFIEKRISDEDMNIAIYGKSIQEEIKDMLNKIIPLKTENKIKKFLGTYKLRTHSLPINALKLQKLEGWSGKKMPFKMPLKVEGIALTSGAWRGSNGEWIYYPDEVVKKAAPLLTGVQFRLNHQDDNADKVVGWVTKSKYGKYKKKSAIFYDGLIFDYKYAKDIYNKKIRKTSVGIYTKEEIDKDKGLVAEDISEFDELSILSENNPACRDATVIAS